ncbi:ribonuclease HI family protein [Candidatus Gracilibacteria bacterium]|nr:ribonuclease HI family protein [Candidatus Gracilibacteria bacterium]
MMTEDNLLTNLKKANKETKRGIIFCDGGSRSNPGPASGGAVLLDANKKEIARDGIFCGVQTNNFAEYAGLIIGLELAMKNNVSDLEVFLDSNLIVEQMNGNYKVKNTNIRPQFEKAKAIAENFNSIKFQHVPRAKNKIADSIVNEVLDANA